jgi:LruC domain-containing protein
VKTSENEAIPGIDFALWTDLPENGGNYLGTSMTNEAGLFETTVSVPTAQEKIVAIGYMSTLVLPINNATHTASYSFGGSAAVKGSSDIIKAAGGIFTFLTPFSNGSGLPSGPLFSHDTITADFMTRVNNALPERANVPVTHPEYLNLSNQMNLKLTVGADVWVTFVHEGADYSNALGYYSYPTNNPPTSASAISGMKIIFPNTSYSGSGGGLRSGDKISLGHFPANTTVSWFLVSDGFAGHKVSESATRFYSNTAFNPESATLKLHCVQLWDGQTSKLLFAFEDMNRTAGSGSDHDFNDAVFYATVSPPAAVDHDNVPDIAPPVNNDHDNDGVPDDIDEFDNDPTKAFHNYTPALGSYGTLAFEDQWPAKGDYDFNDLVIDYNFDQITNAAGNVVQIIGDFKLRAIGANYANGFGIELPFTQDKVASITGSTNPVLERDASRAVVKLFNSAFDIIPQVNQQFINTRPEDPYHQPVTMTLTINLSSPQNRANFNYQAPFNPFLIKQGVRSNEIHLADYPGTSKMDTALFGQFNDTTNIGQNRYFKTATNLPWAINVPVSWAYPVERKQITRTHLAFRNWAESNGNSYQDWYLDKPDYREPANIYQIP